MVSRDQQDPLEGVEMVPEGLFVEVILVITAGTSAD